ncbi:hypothetical protein T439DRAFT_356018 [Meredithblackwellia eburnea MCA 4105]
MSQPYPRTRLRAILKDSSQSEHTLSPKFDLAAFLAYRAFLQRLARETRAMAIEREYGVSASGIGKAKKSIKIDKRDVVKAKTVALRPLQQQ